MLRSNPHSSIVRLLRPAPLYLTGEQESDLNLCTGWERHCSWSVQRARVTKASKFLAEVKKGRHAMRSPVDSLQSLAPQLCRV